jgi:hypothetical protein
MARIFFNKKDFAAPLSVSQISTLNERRASFSARGEQLQYDVFLSHSTKDKNIIKHIKDVLELRFGISVYIDWDEDAGTSRDEMAETVKDAMNRSKTFLIVKTDNSDESSWVPWETGYFDNKDKEKIGVLLIEDDDTAFNQETFQHREFLKSYVILGPEDSIDFINNGCSYIKKKINRNNFVNAPFVVVKPEKMVQPHRNI